MDVENAFRGAKQDSVAMSFSRRRFVQSCGASVGACLGVRLPAQAAFVHDTRLPAATIRAGGTTRSMLQEACDIGGDIILRAGRLYGPPACAVITKPVNIVGDGTVLSAAGVADKGKVTLRAASKAQESGG